MAARSIGGASRTISTHRVVKRCGCHRVGWLGHGRRLLVWSASFPGMILREAHRIPSRTLYFLHAVARTVAWAQGDEKGSWRALHFLAARGETPARCRAAGFARDRGGETTSIERNTRSFDNQEPVRKTQATPARVSPRAARRSASCDRHETAQSLARSSHRPMMSTCDA